MSDVIQKYKERALSSLFIKDVALLQASTLAITALSVASSVILARMLGPEQYGTYAIIFSFTALLASFADWSGANYVVTTFLSRAYVEKNRAQIESIIGYVVKMFLFVFLPLTVLAILVAPQLSTRFYHSSYIGVMTRLLLFENILGAVFGIFKVLLEASRKIKKLTILEVTEKLFFIIIPILFVIFHFGVTGYVWGVIIASTCMVAIGYYLYRVLTRRDPLFPPMRKVLANATEKNSREYVLFGFNASLDKTLSNISATLPIAFLAAVASRSEVGFYKLALSYISLSTLLLKPAARLLNSQLPKSLSFGIGNLKRDFYRATYFSAGFAIIAVVPFILLAKPLVYIFYGERFAPVVALVPALMIFAVISAVSTGIGALFRTIQKVRVAVIINILNFCIAMPISYVIIMQYGVWGMVWSSIGDSLVIAIVCHIYFRNYFSFMAKNTAQAN